MAHRAELLALIAVRSTQTNEVGRCTALLPALGTIAAGYPDGQPLSAPRPRDIGRAQPALRLLRLHLPPTVRRRRSPRRPVGAVRPVHLECAVRGELGDLPASALPAHRGQDGDRCPPDRSHLRRRRPTGCWPACGPTTCRASPACAAPWRPPAPPTDPPTVTGATSSTTCPGVVEGIATRRAAGRVPFLGGGLPQPANGRVSWSRPCGNSRAARPLHYLYAEAPIETPGLPTPPSPHPARRHTWRRPWSICPRTARRRSGWPTCTTTGSGCTGGLLRRTPRRVTTGRHLHPLVGDHGGRPHGGPTELAADGIDGRRGVLP